MKSHARHCRDWRERQIDNKKCIDCSADAVPGRRRCQYHLDKQAEYKRKIRRTGVKINESY